MPNKPIAIGVNRSRPQIRQAKRHALDAIVQIGADNADQKTENDMAIALMTEPDARRSPRPGPTP